MKKFWNNVQRSDGCWTWSGARHERGYGRFRVGSVVHRAHRFAWLITRGDIPQGMHVLHRCDNPSCVRPDHLFLGSHADNMRDKARKGRNTASRKLTASDARAIKAALANGTDMVTIARAYNVTPPCIGAIKHGVTWKHI